MLIVGAKGFAKEVLEIIHQNNDLENLVFYDDVNDDTTGLLYGKFPILKNSKDAKKYLETIDNRFTIGIGNPKNRRDIYKKFIGIGGILTSTISPKANIGSFQTQIGYGCNIMINAVITNDVVIGKGVIINQLSSIGHDVSIGDFTEICPNVSISGNCKIGENVFIGTGAVILPKVSIGNNSIIAAGSVVKEDVSENVMVAGIPAVVKKSFAEKKYEDE